MLGHCVSIMVIQASAGQCLPPGDPAAGELLANIAEQAREASADISGLNRVLNPALEHPLTTEQLKDLLARTAQTGVQIDADIAGDVSSIPGPAARATYRILQEGLTNALRHAPGAAIGVRVDCGDGIRLEVVNGPPPACAAGIGQAGLWARADRPGRAHRCARRHHPQRPGPGLRLAAQRRASG